MEPLKDTAYYRQRAADMHRQAERALTQNLRDSYFTIARHWERLADQSEQEVPTRGTGDLQPSGAVLER